MEEKKYQLLEGIIYKALSGFYYVWADERTYATKPRGKFRHQQLKPLVGDYVEIEVDQQDEQSESRLTQILPRKNALIRPTVANVDYALIVMSLVEPDFSYNLLDYFLVSMESNQVKPIIVLTKADKLYQESESKTVADGKIEKIIDVYQKIGYQVLVKTEVESFKEQLAKVMAKGIYVVMGQSGVGKSTLLNQLLGESIATGEISDYLNRGRHTTREVTLYRFNEGLLADTPGFSAIEFSEIEKEDLGHYFPEIFERSENCRFRGCLHQNEPNCAVKEAVKVGEIEDSRYQNYCQIFEKIEQRKPVYRKKGDK